MVIGDPIKKTSEEILAEAMESLEDASFKFAVFVEGFKKYIEREKGK